MADGDTREFGESDFDNVEGTSEQFKQLREAFKAEKAKRKQAETQVETLQPVARDAALRQAGFDPESKQATALLKLHEGELDAESLQQTADTYGFQPTAGQEPQGGNEPQGEQPAGDGQPQQPQGLSAPEQRAQGLRQQAQPVAPQSLEQRIQDAERNGDIETMSQLNAEKLAQARAAS